MIEVEDELIPTEADELEVDLLEEEPPVDVAPESFDVDSEATTQPELEASAPAREAAAALRANEPELSEDDLAGLDTSDLDAVVGEKDSLFDRSGAELSSDDPETQG